MSRSPHPPVATRLVDPRLGARLERYLRYLGLPYGDARELLDVARMQVYERGLPRTRDEVAPLLFRVAVRRAMDWHRDRTGLPETQEGGVFVLRRPRGRPEPAVAPPEAIEALRALQRLADCDPRHVLALEALRQKEAGKSHARFAAENGLAPGTLRQWIRRFRAHVRERPTRR